MYQPINQFKCHEIHIEFKGTYASNSLIVEQGDKSSGLGTTCGSESIFLRSTQLHSCINTWMLGLTQIHPYPPASKVFTSVLADVFDLHQDELFPTTHPKA